MDLYTKTSAKTSMIFMKSFSTSFSFSSLLFPIPIRRDIANIYGLVRVADEIVDTYRQADSLEILDNLEKETYSSINRGYSANPIVHSFAQTARHYTIDKLLVKSFFASMRQDLKMNNHTKESIEKYIYGSAEVVGLMCLKVFCDGDEQLYNKLTPGARSLGSMYQKVNFLRDLSGDKLELGRTYFPGLEKGLTENSKKRIISDMRKELTNADEALDELPASAKKAVKLSRYYYGALLDKLDKTPAEQIMSSRIRISNIYKFWLMAKVLFQ